MMHVISTVLLWPEPIITLSRVKHLPKGESTCCFPVTHNGCIQSHNKRWAVKEHVKPIWDQAKTVCPYTIDQLYKCKTLQKRTNKKTCSAWHSKVTRLRNLTIEDPLWNILGREVNWTTSDRIMAKHAIFCDFRVRNLDQGHWIFTTQAWKQRSGNPSGPILHYRDIMLLSKL